MCIETCIKFGTACSSKRSQGINESFRIGHVGRAELVSEAVLLPPPKVDLMHGDDEVASVVAMSLLFDFLVATSVCFLYHCSGEGRRTGTARASEDGQDDDGCDA
jgi:hypothetical protein